MFESYHCEKLEKTLHFLPDRVKYCCSCAEGTGIKINDFSNFNKDNIINGRKKFIALLNQGYIPKECKGCIEYKKNSLYKKIQSIFQKPKETKISHIVVNHFKQCNCNCIYCAQKKIYPNQTQNYELLPIIKRMYREGLITTENLTVEFQGGNISELKEFEQLIKEFFSHNCKNFLVLSNAIKYMQILEEIGNNSNLYICISLDAGTKETYKKIKNIDAFEQVIENIKRLKHNSKAQISLKYIIIKDINDNKEELENFLKITKELGNTQPINLEIDYNNTIMSKGIRFEIPKHYYELFEFAEKYCKNNNMKIEISPYTRHILEQGYSI